jgi:branched-chain amino acid aminotransferase
MGTWITGDGKPGAITMEIRNHMLGIQHGSIADTHNWVTAIK